MKNAYFAFKNRQNAHFLKKKSLKNLVIQKKVVPLHPHSEECSLLRGIAAEIAQLVEHNLAKVGVAGPSPVFRSNILDNMSFCIRYGISRQWRGGGIGRRATLRG